MGRERFLKWIRACFRTDKLSRRRGIVKVLFGILLFVLLFVGVRTYRIDTTEQLVIQTVLCLLCGAMIAIPTPSRNVSLAFLLPYFLFVPMRTFLRMEIPIHNLENLFPRTAAVTVAVFFAIYAVFFLLTQRPWTAAACGETLLAIFAIIEYYVRAFRGSVIGPDDFRAVGTALSVAGGYDYTPSPELYYSFLYFLTFILFAFRMDTGYSEKQWRLRSRLAVHIAVSLILAAGIGIFGYRLIWTDYLERNGIHTENWRYVKVNEQAGSVLYIAAEYRAGRMDRPNGYSEEVLFQIGEDASGAYRMTEASGIVSSPHIVLIMNEAFADLRILGEFETNEEVMPFWDELLSSDRALSGWLHPSILGGLTVNSEFEALTGCTMNFLAPSLLPYMNGTIYEGMPSLVSSLESLGYDTLAIHPGGQYGYGRQDVYDALGVDDFIYGNRMETELTYINGFISDRSNYRELIARFEGHGEGTPLFLLNVTIQDHASYSLWGLNQQEGIEAPVCVISIGGRTELDGVDLDSLHGYLNLLRSTDDAFRELITYFENSPEPVILCMFGDHQPILTDEVYDLFFAGQELSEMEKLQRKYIVPYLIWTNYDAGLPEYGEFSTNYLGAVLQEAAGLPLSPYQKFLLELKQEYPILSYMQVTDRTGHTYADDTYKTDPWIGAYRMLQYNLLFDHADPGSLYEPEERSSE